MAENIPNRKLENQFLQNLHRHSSKGIVLSWASSATSHFTNLNGEENVIEEFQRVFEEGMDAFVGGDWASSKAFFEASLAICPRDKPSNRIIMHMDTPENHPDYGLATTPFIAPDGWPGYHILLSK